MGGWSWGGYLTAYTITRTQIFKAAVMGAGLSNMISDHGTDDIPSANLYYYPGQPYDNLDTYWESSAIKHITTEALKAESQRDIDSCAAKVASCFASEDYKEGRKAFMEKRKPNFVGH